MSNIQIELVTSTDPLHYILYRALKSDHSSCFNIICESPSITVGDVVKEIENNQVKLLQSNKLFFIFKTMYELYSSKHHNTEEMLNQNWTTFIITDGLLHESESVITIPFFGQETRLHKLIGSLVVIRKKEKGKDRLEIYTPKLSFIKN